MHTLLMVDDDILFLEVIENRMDFARLGFSRVLTARNATLAMDILEREQVDVLLCDIEMPGKTGLDLIRWLVERHYPAVVLLLTCHPSFTYAKEAIGLDVFDYLLKPIRIEVLEERVQKALQRKHETRWLNTYRKERATLSRNGTDPVDRIRQYIEDNIQTALTREQIGQALFMNPDHLAHIFREKQGQSLNDYIRSRRLSLAKRLLQETNLPLAEICVKIGYAYNTYFFNTFKKATGLSPSDYRLQHTRSESEKEG